MKDPLKSIKVGNFLNNEIGYNIDIYKQYLKIEVALPIDQLMKASETGGVEHERKQLNNLLRDTFNSHYNGLLLFHNEQDAMNRLASYKFIPPDLSNGRWSKTAIITLNSNSFYEHIEEALDYIDFCLEGKLSQDFTINSIIKEISVESPNESKNSRQYSSNNSSQETYISSNKNSNETASAGAFFIIIWIATIVISILSGIMAWNWIEPDNFWRAIGFLIAWGLLSKIGHLLATIIFGVISNKSGYLD